MYGQMTAGSWIYIGTQGDRPGHLRDLRRDRRQEVWRNPRRHLTLTGGCGGMGGAQPLAVTLNGGACLIVDVDPARLHRRVEHRYLDEVAPSLRRGGRAGAGRQAGTPRLVVGVVGNAAEVFPSCSDAGWRSTSSPTRPRRTTRCHTCRWGSRSRTGPSMPRRSPRSSPTAPGSRWPGMSRRWSASWTGAETFDYGNSIRDEARLGSYDQAFAFPGFVPAYIRPLFCEGRARSGGPRSPATPRYRRDRRGVLRLFPDNDRLHRWMRGAQERIAFQGFTGADLLARVWRAGPGRAGLQRPRGEGRGVGADRHRPGPPRLRVRRVAIPGDRGDGRRLRTRSPDWPLLNALTAASSGATWVSIHHGGGVGIGQRSIHAGRCRSPTGPPWPRRSSPGADQRPGHGVIRHVDAGYAGRRGRGGVRCGSPMRGAERTTSRHGGRFGSSPRLFRFAPGMTVADPNNRGGCGQSGIRDGNADPGGARGPVAVQWGQ